MSEKINYNFEIIGSGRRKSPATLTINYTFSFNDNNRILYEGSKTFDCRTDEDGVLFYNDNETIPFKIENEKINGYTINVDCSIRAVKNDVTFTKSFINITFTKTFKYEGCINVDDVKTVDANYKTVDISDEGVWIESLADLENGSHMFYDCSNLTTFTSDLSSLTDGDTMFRDCDNLTTFISDLGELTDGTNMFCNCYKLESFTSDSSGSPVNLSSLTTGNQMFSSCANLSEFTYNLSSLTGGVRMFQDCYILTTFTSDLSSLKDGGWMFYNCSKLETFTSDSSGSPVNLSSLIDGEEMFAGCPITSFTSDLSSLTKGSSMFGGCSNLESFTSDLGSLIDGWGMFGDCNLNEDSLLSIADNINDISDLDRENDEDWQYEVSGQIRTIEKEYRGRIDIDYNESVSEDVRIACGNKLIKKGWVVYFNDTLYEYIDVSSPYDVSEANGYCPDAWKNGSDSWNTVVLKPNMDVLKISIVNEKGDMLNDE